MEQQLHLLVKAACWLHITLPACVSCWRISTTAATVEEEPLGVQVMQAGGCTLGR